MSDADRDALIRRVLTGDASLSDPAVARAFERDPELAPALEELERLASELDGAGRLQRSALEEARRAASPVGSDLVAPVLAGLASEARGTRESGAGREVVEGPPPVQGGPRRLLAVAAIFLALVPVVWFATRPEPDDRFLLGPSALELLEPRAPVRAWGRFLWRFELAAGGWFSVEIRDADASADAPPLARAAHLTESEWTPAEQLPTRIRLRLRAYDPTGEVVAGLDRELSLSP